MASDVIFCHPRKEFVAQCEWLISEFGLQKMFSQRKKSFPLKLRKNRNYRRDENIYFQKKAEVAIE